MPRSMIEQINSNPVQIPMFELSPGTLSREIERPYLSGLKGFQASERDGWLPDYSFLFGLLRTASDELKRPHVLIDLTRKGPPILEFCSSQGSSSKSRKTMHVMNIPKQIKRDPDYKPEEAEMHTLHNIASRFHPTILHPAHQISELVADARNYLGPLPKTEPTLMLMDFIPKEIVPAALQKQLCPGLMRLRFTHDPGQPTSAGELFPHNPVSPHDLHFSYYNIRQDLRKPILATLNEETYRHNPQVLPALSAAISEEFPVLDTTFFN